MSPWIAPQVAIAAETPQIATDEESMAAKSSSTLSLRASQKQTYQITDDDEDRLQDAQRAGLQHLHEEQPGAEDHETGLDVVLGLHRRA